MLKSDPLTLLTEYLGHLWYLNTTECTFHVKKLSEVFQYNHRLFQTISNSHLRWLSNVINESAEEASYLFIPYHVLWVHVNLSVL